MACNCARALVALILALGHTGCTASTGARFRGSRVEDAGRTVATQDVEASLRTSMELVLQGGGSVAARQLARIEAGMWRTFQSLPKNAMGRLAPRAVRYIIHSYFAKEHGWLIKGLEPHGMQLDNMTEVHDVNILQDKAPALVEALLEARRSGHGLSLDDVVAMAAALERLIFDESLALLQASYFLNGLSAGSPIGEDALHEVLSSYLLLFELGARGNLSDAARHQALKAKIAKAGGSWATLVEFEQDAIHNFQFSRRNHLNPFMPREYSFQEAVEIIEDLAQGYGKWQNMECRQMKGQLTGLDLDGTGRVPLSSFYSQPETADYQFTESVEYLRQIGALDEAEGSRPLVRIANYMTGPSNCIASSSYYSVCCLSDCEGLMNELEGKVRAPTASPQQLLSLVGNLSADAEQPLPQGLEEKLLGIASRHGECPFPQVSKDAAALTPGHWLDKKATAPKEVRQQHLEMAGSVPATAESLEMQWSDDEVLPLQEPQHHGRTTLGVLAQGGAQLLLLVVLLRTIFAYAASYRGKTGKDSLDLPLR